MDSNTSTFRQISNCVLLCETNLRKTGHPDLYAVAE